MRLGQFFRQEEDERLRKDNAKAKEEMIRSAAALKKLTLDDKSGWKEFAKLIDDYVEKSIQRKRLTDISVADDKTIAELRFLDRDIKIMLFIKQIPALFIKNIDDIMRQEQESEGVVNENG